MEKTLPSISPQGASIENTNETIRKMSEFILSLSDGQAQAIAGTAGRYEDVDLLVRLARTDDDGNFRKAGISDPSEILDIPGVTLSFGGEFESTRRSYTSLTFAFFIAILGIYVILASQFKDYFQPIIILSAVAFAVIGVSYGHYYSRPAPNGDRDPEQIHSMGIDSHRLLYRSHQRNNIDAPDRPRLI